MSSQNDRNCLQKLRVSLLRSGDIRYCSELSVSLSEENPKVLRRDSLFLQPVHSVEAEKVEFLSLSVQFSSEEDLRKFSATRTSPSKFVRKQIKDLA